MEAGKDANQATQGLSEGDPMNKTFYLGPERTLKDASQATQGPFERDPMKKIPYLGPERTFRSFRYDTFEREMFSPKSSSANCYQTCSKCKTEINPNSQFRLLKGSGVRNKAPPHQQDLCQKCTQLDNSSLEELHTYDEEDANGYQEEDSDDYQEEEPDDFLEEGSDDSQEGLSSIKTKRFITSKKMDLMTTRRKSVATTRRANFGSTNKSLFTTNTRGHKRF